MKSFTVKGNSKYVNCQIESDADPNGQMTQTIKVDAEVPAIIAVIGDPLTGEYPTSGKVVMTILGPDGTVYDTPITNARNKLVLTDKNGNVNVIAILNPDPGLWSITCTCIEPCAYRANLFTLPQSDKKSFERYTPHFASLLLNFEFASLVTGCSQ